MEKVVILNQNYGLTPLEKCQFLEYFKILFLWSRKTFSLFEISWNTLSCPILPKIKRRKNYQSLTKTMD